MEAIVALWRMSSMAALRERKKKQEETAEH